MKQIIKILVTLLLVLLPLTVSAASITNLRSSVSPARVRIVLDSADPIAYEVEKDGKKLVVNLPGSTTTEQNLAIRDKFVKSVQLERVKRKASQLTINMTKACQYKIYQLQAPNRLVIDLFRIELVQKEKNLAKGVKYIYLQDEMNGKQIQACVVSIAPDAKFELRPFSAAGTYNGRGLLSRAAAQRGLKAAVNASYFDSDGWVIGVTKDRGAYMSMDDTPRSAYVDDGKHRFIVKDVAYEGTLRTADVTMPIKGMNRARIAEDVVLFNEYYATSTKTNMWGRELKLRDNKVVAISDKGNMSIEPGTVVVSAHGISNKALLGKVRVGDRVKLEQKLNVPEADAAPIVVGGGPLLLENGKVNVRSREEHIAGDIANGRAPRTAVGIKRDGTVLLLVVDGRSSSSNGLTLQELATYFLRLGARDAINLDGGGSSVMVINGQIVNKPSDGRERAVSMGLGLFPEN